MHIYNQSTSPFLSPNLILYPPLLSYVLYPPLLSYILYPPLLSYVLYPPLLSYVHLNLPLSTLYSLLSTLICLYPPLLSYVYLNLFLYSTTPVSFVRELKAAGRDVKAFSQRQRSSKRLSALICS